MAGKYAHLVKPLSSSKMGERMRLRQEEGGQPIERPRVGATGSGNADKIYWLTGKDDLEGINLNFSWGFYSGLGDWHTGQDPHTHPYDECLVFVGLDPTDITYLGAEIEIALGEEKEKHTFNVPTAVIVPRGLPHFPLDVKKVDKPFGFIVYNLGPRHDTTWLD